MIVRAETLEGCSVELFLVVRMGNADEEFRALLHRPAVEVHGSELSHYMMDV